jgi:N-acetylmuramoyl-L-alanine amidase
MRVNKFLFFVFILASFFLSSVFSQNQAFAKQNPRAAYARAESRYKRLLKNKRKRRLRTSWEQCIAAFDAVASSAPGTSYARLASYSAAQAREGLYKVSRVQADLDDASKAYSGCIRDYPGSPEAARAEKRLKALGISPATAAARSGEDNKGKETAAPPTVTVSVPATATVLPVKEDIKEGESSAGTKVADTSKGLVRINEIRHWSNPGYTRVVIDMEGAVRYSSSKLKDPDRLFFDLKDAELPKGCKGSDLDVNDGILRKIRASQFDADTVRVVLDLASIVSSRTLMLEHPTRLIIDVTGQERQARALRAAPRYRRGKGGRFITLRPVQDLGTAPPLEDKPDDAATGQAASADVQQTTAETGNAAPASEEKVSEAAPYPKAPKLGSASTIVPAAAPVARKQPPAPAPPAPAPKMCIGTIVIDPGHGGKDTGAIGYNGLYEKDVVLDIGLKLRDIIKKNYDCKVVMTRDKDVFIDLDARPGIAVQNDADLFISIHANASKRPSAHGIETYLLNLTKDRNIMEVADRENFAAARNMGSLDVILKDLILDSKRDESLKLAHCIQTSLVTDLHKDRVINKGVKQGPFLVLYGASMPSILTEVGFITNPEEESHLADPRYRTDIAQAIFDGIKEYLDSSRVAQYQAPK